jgi:hypothetical protein
VDDRDCKQRELAAGDPTADDADAKRTAQLGTRARAESKQARQIASPGDFPSLHLEGQVGSSGSRFFHDADDRRHGEMVMGHEKGDPVREGSRGTCKALPPERTEFHSRRTLRSHSSRIDFAKTAWEVQAKTCGHR